MTKTIIYNASLTLSDFHRSRAFYRGVRGPVGSGKSTAMCWEIMRRAQEQAADSNGVRRTRFAVIRNCYDDQTEILTERRGWQLFKDLLIPGDRVATLQGEKMIYEEPSAVAVFPYSGEMVGFESEGIDFLVTPDHDLVISKRRTRKKIWGEFERVSAESVYGNSLVRMRKDAGWDGEDIGLSEDVFEWLGFWFAEGCYNIKDECIITSVTGLEYAKDLFYRAGLKYRTRKRQDDGENLCLHDNDALSKQIVELIKYAGKAGIKEIPYTILSASRPHLKAFLKGFAKGDGNIYKNTTRLYTSSKKLADQLQELAIKAGGTATIAMRNRVGRAVKIGKANGKVNYPEYIITLLGDRKLRPILSMNKKMTNHLKGWYKQQYEGMVYCVEMPFSMVMVRRNGKTSINSRTYPQLKDTTTKTWADWFPSDRFGKINQQRMTHHIRMGLPDGTTADTEILFRALDRPDDVVNVLSLEITGAWVNEAREVPKGIIDALGDRAGRFPGMKDGGCTWRGVMMDTNSPDDDHWWYRLSEIDRPKGWRFFSQPGGLIEDIDGKFKPNPKAENIKNLEPNYYLTRLAGKDADYIRVYYCGQYGFVKEGKPVINEYVDALHCAPEPLSAVPGLPIWVGIDFGLTPAAVFAQRLPLGRWQWIDELVTEDMGAVRFAELLKAKMLGDYSGFTFDIWGDPSGDTRSQVDEVTPFLVLEAKGIPAKPAPTNDAMLRREAIAVPLSRIIDGKPGLMISPKCVVTRKGLAGGYHYRRVQVSGEERYQDKPFKNKYSHPCFLKDTLISTPDGNKQIQELTKGDLVTTPYGPKPIADTTERQAETIRLRFNNGVELISTKEHPFWNFYCYSPADVIKYSQILSQENGLWKWLFRFHRSAVGQNGQYMNFSVSDIIGNRPRDIINRVIGGVTNIFTALFGNITTGQSRLAMQSTIGTETLPTTLSGTSVFCQIPIIIPTTQANRKGWNFQNTIYLEPSKKQQNGERLILRKQVKLEEGEGKDLIEPEKNLAWWRKIVFFAGRFFQGRLWVNKNISVLTTARTNGVTRPAWMMKIGYVVYAAVVFVLTSICRKGLVHLVVRENYSPKSSVYNITVAEAHCYYANGILVSNCEAGGYLMIGAGEGDRLIETTGPKFTDYEPDICTGEHSWMGA